MTASTSAQLVGTGGAAVVGLGFGLPNPISAAIYALIAAVAGWVVTWLLNALKKRLGL